MKPGARRVAYQVLSKVTEGEAFVNLTLQHSLRENWLDDRDRALCTEIVYGTVQRQRSLDILLQAVCKRPLVELDPKVLTILRMTVYQMGFLDRVPAYAAIHEAVDMCKSAAPRAAGFVNGVLRALTRSNMSLESQLEAFAESAANEAEQIGMLLSYPTWLVKSLVETFGKSRAIAILRACNRRSPLSIRVNPLKISPAALIEVADTTFGVGFAEVSPVSPVGIRFHKGIDIERWSPYTDGDVTVQDDGAMLIPPLLEPMRYLKVLDMCAAPGSKTTQIAELQGDRGNITACDIHAHKVRLIERATSRLGLKSVKTVCSDARALARQASERSRYDAVLLDAPCSGFGVLRHRPDIRWRRTAEDVAKLGTLQLELLRAAVELVRPGGVIVYATCTLLPEENQQVVARVVQEVDGELEWEDVRPFLPEAARPFAEPNGHGLLLTPELFETDGFFMARLRKREA